MAAKVFQIIGIVVLVIGIILVALILPIISKLLKKANRAIASNRSQINMQMRSSMEEMENAEVQMQALADMTSSVKQGIDAAVDAADRAVHFLESNTFQIGFPVVIWIAILFTTITRGLFWRRQKKKAKGVTPIPPPSWEQEAS